MNKTAPGFTLLVLVNIIGVGRLSEDFPAAFLGLQYYQLLTYYKVSRVSCFEPLHHYFEL